MANLLAARAEFYTFGFERGFASRQRSNRSRNKK
jgi:hypothetical protein